MPTGDSAANPLGLRHNGFEIFGINLPCEKQVSTSGVAELAEARSVVGRVLWRTR
jgi:hypothetical protein